MRGSSDIAILRTARGPIALPVFRVLIGGFASRHDLPVDHLDDIQLAVETLLRDEPEGDGDLVLEVSADNVGMKLRLGGLLNQDLKAALLDPEAFSPQVGCPIDVGMLLDSLLDDYQVLDEEAGRFAVEMEKRVP